jgi:hypothetical protein
MVLVISSCGYKKEATGFYDKIYIFGDEALYKSMKDALEQTLGNPQEVPVNEPKYILEYRSFDDFDQYNTAKNVLFLIAKDHPSPLDGIPDRLLGPNAKAAAEAGEINFFMAKNAYANNQALLFYVCNGSEQAAEHFTEQFYRINTFEQFENYTLERMYSDAYAYGENTSSNSTIAETVGVTFRHPSKFSTVDFNTKPDSNLVSMFSNSPTRWLWLKSFDTVDGDSLTAEKVISLRNYTMSLQFEGDSVVSDNELYLKSELRGDYQFLRLQGTYKTYDNDRVTVIGGGPFITYAYFNPSKKKIWLADAHMFAPTKRKSLTLMTLETYLMSFYPEIRED